MTDKENKNEEVKNEEKTTNQVQENVKKDEKTNNGETEKRVKEEAKKEDNKPESKEVKTQKNKETKTETKKFEASKQNTTPKKEINKTNKKSSVPAILTVLIVIAIVAVLTVLIVTSSDPKKTVDGYLTNLKAGDFVKAKEFVIGKNIFENQKYSEETQKLLFDKISWKVKKTAIEKDNAKVEIEVTNKDFSKIVENCMKKLLNNFKAVLEGNVSEQSVEKYFVEELKSDNVEMKTETKTIELQKQDGKWKVVLNKELENVILPGFEEAVNTLQ